MAALLKASQAIDREIQTEQLLRTLINTAVQNAGADRGLLLLKDESQLWIQAEACLGHETVVLQKAPLLDETLPLGLIRYAERTAEVLMLSPASTDARFAREPYFAQHDVQSVLAQPILNQGRVMGLLYLENSTTAGAFTHQRLELLNVLAAQSTISVENAQLVANLEQKVAERMAELARQKAIVEQKNQDMLDSIQYGSSIQRALLPQLSELNQYLPNSFVFYQPKDIVSGDFDWFARHADQLVIVAADCTGHGVPGAFMAILGRSCLYEIVEQKGITHPGAVLSALHARVTESLSSDGRTLNDGMDMAVCTLDIKTHALA